MAYPSWPDAGADRLELQQLELWKSEQLFRRTLEAGQGGEPYVFYEGPPTANGRPGIHHVFARTIKDLICRFHAMQGQAVTRIAGWDTHGLPVEIEVEKELKLSGKKDIERFGVAEFNARARTSVFKYQSEWESLSDRIGYWLDYEHPYVTCSNEYIETVWWLLKRLRERDLLYRGHRVLPYCPRCGTVLSSHELALGYQDVTTNSVYLTFPLETDPTRQLLVWTTTPWTLLSNVAVAVNPELEYGEYQVGDRRLILATARASLPSSSAKGAPTFAEIGALRTFPGAELLGQRYRRPLDVVALPDDRVSRLVVPGDFVTSDDGSGLVHMAPAFGADDYQAGVGAWAGAGAPGGGRRHVHRHRVARDRGSSRHGSRNQRPHHRPAQAGWPLASHHAVRAHVSALLALFQPAHLLRARFLVHPHVGGQGADARAQSPGGLASARGRVPADSASGWRTTSTGPCRATATGARRYRSGCATAMRRTSRLSAVTPSWRSAGARHCRRASIRTSRTSMRYDWTCPCGGAMRRTPEVIDTWFDSGAMPYAQWHYPFEHEQEFASHFPADFICEGVDQTRGWFYSLLAIATTAFDAPAYKHVIVNELVLDPDGQKMSKSKGNVVDPWEMIREFGADTVRLYLLASSQVWLPKRFDRNTIKDVAGKFFNALKNSYVFFAGYAEDWKPGNAPPAAERPLVDRWLLSRLMPPSKRSEGPGRSTTRPPASARSWSS